MRVRCRLREIRGDRTLAEIAHISGVHVAELSKIERGIALPRDEWLPGLEHGYGVPHGEWWPAAFTGADGQVLVALEPDVEGGNRG